MESSETQKELLEFLKNFKDYSYIGKLINSNELWFDRLEQELILLDKSGKIDYTMENIEEVAKDAYPLVFNCSKYTYQYLDALYIVLIEGILKDYLLQTVNADFLVIQDKLNDYKAMVNNLGRPISKKEIEKIQHWNKMLISKKLDFHITERLIELFETKFAEIIKKNQEDDVLLTRLIELRDRRISMINNLERKLQLTTDTTTKKENKESQSFNEDSFLNSD
ncbi:hypothetical protein ACO0SA_000907 [Hanseniaspora valbyensis]